MHKFLAYVCLLLVPNLALAQVRVSYLSPADLGVSAAALSGTPTTGAIAMDSPSVGSFNTLLLTATGTPGTTTAVVVACYTSPTEAGPGLTGYTPINACSSAASATCAADLRSYTFTVAAGSGFTSMWRTGARWMKCTFTDAGTGTLSVSAQRSKQ